MDPIPVSALRRSLCPSPSVFQSRQREGLWALRCLEGRRTGRAGAGENREGDGVMYPLVMTNIAMV